MRIVVLDVSKRHIGIAISDQKCDFISEICEIRTSDITSLSNIKIKYKPDLFIVGLPLDLYTTKSNNLDFVKEWSHGARHIIKPYMFIDERFSSNLAERVKIDNHSKHGIDGISAALLMEKAFCMKDYIWGILQKKQYDIIL